MKATQSQANLQLFNEVLGKKAASVAGAHLAFAGLTFATALGGPP
jgi:hypothetical protein